MTQTVTQPKSTSIDKNIILFIGMLFLFSLIVIFILNMRQFESVELQGHPAPEFTLTLFDQFEADEISLKELRGQVVVINFWASWCVQCFEEARLLEQAWRDYQDKGVMFIGVDYLDTEKPALEYMKRYDITYPSGPDIGDKISQDYAISGVPETFFIDRDGNIVHVQIGPIDQATLYNLLEKLVAQPGQEI